MNWTKVLTYCLLTWNLISNLLTLSSISYVSVRKSPCFPDYEKALFLIEKEMGNTEKYEVNKNSFPM